MKNFVSNLCDYDFHRKTAMIIANRMLAISFFKLSSLLMLKCTLFGKFCIWFIPVNAMVAYFEHEATFESISAELN